MRALAVAVTLCFASQALAQDLKPVEKPGLIDTKEWTPPYLPRYATLGIQSSINQGGTLSGLARVGWLGTLIDQRTNFVFLFELGAGYSISLPAGATDLYQYTAMVGVGLRPRHDTTLQWGFSVLVGGLLYGAHYQGMYSDQWSDGVVEGRLHFGYNFGPLNLGAFFGVMQIWYTNIRKLSSTLVGGWNVGVVVDWR
ncbi:MAG: hypothetical protein QM723_03110 [Myxococcaceae bacterium]